MRIGCDSARDAGELLRAVESWTHHDDVAPFLTACADLREALALARAAVDEIRHRQGR